MRIVAIIFYFFLFFSCCFFRCSRMQVLIDRLLRVRSLLPMKVSIFPPRISARRVNNLNRCRATDALLVVQGAFRRTSSPTVAFSVSRIATQSRFVRNSGDRVVAKRKSPVHTFFDCTTNGVSAHSGHRFFSSRPVFLYSSIELHVARGLVGLIWKWQQ